MDDIGTPLRVGLVTVGLVAAYLVLGSWAAVVLVIVAGLVLLGRAMMHIGGR